MVRTGILRTFLNVFRQHNQQCLHEHPTGFALFIGQLDYGPILSTTTCGRVPKWMTQSSEFKPGRHSCMFIATAANVRKLWTVHVAWHHMWTKEHARTQLISVRTSIFTAKKQSGGVELKNLWLISKLLQPLRYLSIYLSLYKYIYTYWYIYIYDPCPPNSASRSTLLQRARSGRVALATEVKVHRPHATKSSANRHNSHPELLWVCWCS